MAKKATAQGRRSAADIMADPYSATLTELLAVTVDIGAGSFKFSGEDEDGTPVFCVLVAVKDEAARLYPEIERLTDPDRGGEDES